MAKPTTLSICWILAILRFSLTLAAEGPYCYECSNVAEPELCHYIQKCGDKQKCFVEKMYNIGHESYKLGCKDALTCNQHSLIGNSLIGKRYLLDEHSLANCSQCCSGDFCNSDLCISNATRGLRCMSCMGTARPEYCDVVTTCGVDYQCYIQSKDEHHFDMGCMPQLQCQALTDIHVNSGCIKCCNSTNNCNLHACDPNQVSNWGDWTSWSICSVTCSSGTKYRTRHCHGTACEGNNREQHECSQPVCVVDGLWNTWESWTGCSRTCGNGVTLRTRLCDNPTPLNGGNTCTGYGHEFAKCKITDCPIDGGWSAYTNSTCSVTCGSGLQTSIRQCTNPTPKFGGKNCTGNPVTYSPCRGGSACITIDGGWSEWSALTECRVLCGDGHVRRTRTCTNPASENGGKHCSGNATSTTNCNNGPCSSGIHVCDKMMTVVAMSVSTPYTNAASSCGNPLYSISESLVEHLCHAPADRTLWKLGINVLGNCELLPLYVPVGRMDKVSNKKTYGIMTDCYQDTLTIVTQSCDNNSIHEQSIKLVKNELEFHMLLW